MTWSSVHIDEKEEINAAGRARSGKIKDLDSFKGVPPGKLKLKVEYHNECLTVHVEEAKDLAGKRSQDSYAWCYLLGKDGKCYFQRNNDKTNVFDKNLNPNFNHRFDFKMSAAEVNSKSLVVSIWDKDTKSKDDFMAGVRISMQNIQYSQERSLFWISLRHQGIDGHPAEISEMDMSLFKIAIEEKPEENAAGRARSGKIKDEASFKGVPPGKLKLKVEYHNECLTVHVEEAKDLAGKRSQDPYAWCYLLGKDGKCYFQMGNNKTTVFDKSLNPVFKHRFDFKMSAAEVNSKSLVISIWDEDTKSRDDFMAGVRISLKYVQYFQERNYIWISLRHQNPDGHPEKILETDMSLFKIVMGGMWDLKTCNNHLVAFIDRARVLAEACELKGSLPSSLHEKTSLMPPDASRLFEEEILRLKRMISLGKAKFEEKNRELYSLKKEYSLNEETHRRNCGILKDKHAELYTLEIRETELSGKIVGLDYLREQIRILEMRILTEKQRIEKGSVWQDVGFINVVDVYAPKFDELVLGDSKYEEEKRKIEMRIRSEFQQKMIQALEKARKNYASKYFEFIQKIKEDADEIIRLYDDLIKERSLKSADKRSYLLEIERARNYQLRIDQLNADIRALELRIGPLQGKLGGLDGDYRRQLAAVDVQLNDLKQKLRSLFAMFAQFAEGRCSETSELSIYNNLLNFEEGRLSDARHSVQKRVTVSESVKRATHSAEFSSSRGGTSFSSTYRRESGYSSPATTPSSVNAGGMTAFEFNNAQFGEVASTRTTSRSSRSSYAGTEHQFSPTSTIRSSRRSVVDNVFDEIRPQII